MASEPKDEILAGTCVPRAGGSTLGTQNPGWTEPVSTPLTKRPGLRLGQQPRGAASPASTRAHLGRAARGEAGAGDPPARRSSSRLPACCSGPEIHLQTSSAGLSPIAERETEKREAPEVKRDM